MADLPSWLIIGRSSHSSSFRSSSDSDQYQTFSVEMSCLRGFSCRSARLQGYASGFVFAQMPFIFLRNFFHSSLSHVAVLSRSQ